MNDNQGPGKIFGMENACLFIRLIIKKFSYHAIVFVSGKFHVSTVEAFMMGRSAIVYEHEDKFRNCYFTRFWQMGACVYVNCEISSLLNAKKAIESKTFRHNMLQAKEGIPFFKMDQFYLMARPVSVFGQ